MSKNGMANYQRSSSYVNLTHLPTPKQERVITFDKLTGGLNLYAPDYELKRNESPDMVNMLWKNGVLCSRYGQSYVSETPLLEYTFADMFLGVANQRVYTISSIVYEGEDRLVRISEVEVAGEVVTNWTYIGEGKIMFFTAPAARAEITVTTVFADKDIHGYACSGELFWGNEFFHIGQCIYCAEPGSPMTLTLVQDLSHAYHGTSETEDLATRGTFLRYRDDLIYKSRGVFLRISYLNGVFTAHDVFDEAYTPIMLLNTNWESGAGDMYQPPNFLSPKRQVWYNVGTSEQTASFTAAAGQTTYTIADTTFAYVTDIFVNGATLGNWTVTGSTIHFYALLSAGDTVEVRYQHAVATYKLPESGATVLGVTVDGASAGWTYDQNTGIVTLNSAPAYPNPFASNTVRITYQLTTYDGYKNIMDCPYAIVYGGNQNICMVVGGSRYSPSAFFWNGNNVAMDPGYWPAEHYNFGGDTEEAITGFGRQQGNLVVFKTNSVGKVTMNFTTVSAQDDGTARTYIEMDYTGINSLVGCDYPWSIQLIDNNLVFCNSKQGVHFLTDSSAARENNVVCISRKVNGDTGRIGILARLRTAEKVASFDDDKRYWLIIDDQVFCWDYELSEHRDPSWFYLTNIDAVGLFKVAADIYHLGRNGRITVFDSTYADYGQEMPRRYRFATEYFYSYDRLKSVPGLIFSFRTDTNIEAKVTYLTDYETRDDETLIKCSTWSLVPRDLSFRDLSVDSPFAYVAKRRPGCRHIRHFGMVLTCTKMGVDMPILSAQLFYKYEGRERGNVHK